jgi:hypothetical protein
MQEDTAETKNISRETAVFRLSCVKFLSALYDCYCKFITVTYNINKVHTNTLLAPSGQFNHYYQYGQTNDCRDEWDDTVFCLSLKLKKPYVAEALFQERETILKASGKRPQPFWELRNEPPHNFPPKIEPNPS